MVYRRQTVELHMTLPANIAYEFGPFRLEPAERRLLRDGQDVPLPPKALDLVIVLVSRAGRLVTKETLLQEVWQDTFVEEANLSYTVSLLRKTLEDSAERYIETVQKRGYRFRTPVRTLSDADSQQSAAAVTSIPPQGAAGGVQSRPLPGKWIGPLLAVSMLIVAGLLVGTIVSQQPRTAGTSLGRARFDVPVPDHVRIAFTFGPIVVSPNGQYIAFAGLRDSRRQIWLRALESGSFMALPDTDDVSWLWWSPDSKSIAFFARGKLKRVDAVGGPVSTLCDAPVTFGAGAWSRHGVILFSTGRIVQVSDTGGVPTPLSALDSSRPEPQQQVVGFLSDGRRFVFAERRPLEYYVASLDTPHDRQLLFKRGAEEIRDLAVAPGYLVYHRRGTVMAQALDEETLQLRDAPITLGDGASTGPSMSDRGLVAFRSRAGATKQFTWVDRQGTRLSVVGTPDSYVMVELSPTGTRAAAVRGGPWMEDMDLLIVDLRTGVSSRLTSYPGIEADPVWSNDERLIAYTSAQAGMRAPFLRDMVTGREERLVEAAEELAVDDWTPDGRQLIVRSLGRSVFGLALEGERKLHLLADTPQLLEDQVQVSPDGAWAAFEGAEYGSSSPPDIYVVKFPAFTDRRQVSSAGGRAPRWRRDGKELFFLATDGTMMVVDWTPGGTSGTQLPRALFRTTLQLGANPSGVAQYDVAPDGQRFLILDLVREPKDTFTFLLNWMNGPAGPNQ